MLRAGALVLALAGPAQSLDPGMAMTIKSYAKSIFRKLGVAGRTEATTTAIQRGIIHIDDQ